MFITYITGMGYKFAVLQLVFYFYSYEKTTADKEMAEAFISQTNLDTAITNPYAFSGSEILLQKFGEGCI